MDIAVIGGGAAGMMAAITAAQAGASVCIYEAGDLLGRKILSTGNGRCNLTNLALDPARYQGSFRRHASLLLKEFGVDDTLAFFHAIGIPVIAAGSARGDDSWVYPLCKEAAALRMALDIECERQGVARKKESRIQEIVKKEGIFQILSESGQVYKAQRVIIATGGRAFPKSGSDGSGYRLVQRLGHSVVEPLPALGPLICDNPHGRNLAGIRMEAQLTMRVEGSETARERGEIQFTDYGLSGIPVFQLSGLAAREMAAGHEVVFSLDFIPDMNESEVLMDLAERKIRRGERESGTLLLGLIPSKMVPALFKEAGIALHVPCSQIHQSGLMKLARLLKDFTFVIRDTKGFDACQATSGGIPATEVSLNLESIKTRGLFFAGEILDIDGPCGGYNLQWAWTSGYGAGKAAAREESVYDG